MPRFAARFAACLAACLSLLPPDLAAAPAQSATNVAAAPAPAHLLDREWDARWIAPAGAPARGYGVYHFRKSIHLDAAPDRFVVHVSADNRYRLFVNGRPAHIGPARGDRTHWRFDSLDLAPLLHTGENLLAVQVWNFAEHAPVAQLTDRTAFILQGDSGLEAIANTDTSWTSFTNPAYTPIGDMGARLRTYIVVGPGDEVDAARYPWGWEQPAYDASAWTPAQILRPGRPRGTGTDGIWLLVPREIPLLEAQPMRLRTVRRSTGVAASADFVRGTAPVTVPPHTRATLLLDHGEHTTGYPELRVSGGQGATVRLSYAESLYEGKPGPGSKRKGHRDVVEGKHLIGFFDVFHADGAADRVFRPLRWRTWRYLQLEVETAANPLILEDLRAEFTAYPLVERARFDSPDPELGRIWDIAWRTMRTGTHDLFTDSPYYEQLSYVGDTRIEALVSVLVGGDDRLMRQAITAFDASRDASGLTSSRWPDSRHQRIPPYSLVWISMVHDYWMLRDDPGFVRARLPGVHEVLRYYAEHSDPATGSYTGRQWWNYIDWIPAWGRDPVTGLGGVPPRDAHGSSAVLDLHHVYTLQQAAELCRAFGEETQAATYAARAARLRRHVLDTCWNNARGLVADTPDQLTYSQHANSYLILSADDDERAKMTAVAERMLADPDLAQATFYFSFYSHAASVWAGLGEHYLDWLTPWRGVLAMGLTTVPETPAPDSRSDAHAWGSHPLLGLLGTVLGIRPAEPGFKSVLIQPHLGNLPRAAGRMPHPLGEIEVALVRTAANGLQATVTLPPGLSGTLRWNGRQVPLVAGGQTLTL